MNIVLVVLGIVLFIGLVLVHEFGHFMVAKRNGVKPLEFGIFMSPRIIAWKMKGGWEFSLNWLPIGGFVRLKGEHDTDTEPGSFGAASLWVKTKIMLAGIVMNLVTAFVLFVLLALVGMPQLVGNQFLVKSDAIYVSRASMYIAAGTVEADSPAAKAGITSGDTIVSFGPAGHETPINQEETLLSLTPRYAGQTVDVTYRRAGSTTEVVKTVQLRSAAAVEQARAAGKQIGYFGLSVYQAQTGMTVVRSTWSAPIVAVGTMGQFTALTFQGLGKAMQGLGGIVAGFATHNTSARVAAQNEAAAQVSGPVGIFYVLRYGSTLGIRFILFIIAVLSLSLGIINLLPIPALDGGRLWLILITRAIKRPLSASHEEAINAAGFALLLGLLALITIVDVRRFH